MAGKTFPDGSASVDLHCVDGKWTLSRSDWSTVPNCKRNTLCLYRLKKVTFSSIINLPFILSATCDPACENGGECIDTNFCVCAEQFRGDHCQYRRYPRK